MAGPGGQGGTGGETLAELGEAELIRRLGAFAPPGAFDDDAALLPLLDSSSRPLREGASEPAEGPESPGHRALVVNTDVLVEGLHFSDATTEAADVGWRAAAANLSDLAAMGCSEVLGLTVGLVAPSATPWAWVEGVYTGLEQALERYGGQLLGGDCSGGGQRMVAITAVGRLAAEGGPIQRRDGRPGDWLVATGPHGLSRLGLALLQGEAAGAGQDAAGALDGLDPGLIARAIAAHQRPLPRFDAVGALIANRPAGTPWRVGGCDSSDGLVAAVRAIASTSGCAARLDRARLPLDPAMAILAEAERWCLSGGEDFELVLALEPAWAEAMLEVLPRSSRIGQLVTGEAGALSWSDGGAWPLKAAGSGYSHFS
jgi:thiamine-monophosphate kinase